jgi:hypothetical protein
VREDAGLLAMKPGVVMASRPVKLKKGKYVMMFKARGAQPVLLPRVEVHFGSTVLTRVAVGAGKQEYKVNFELFREMEAPFSIAFTDCADADGANIVGLASTLAVRPY